MKINRTYLMTAALLSATCLFCGCGTAKIEENKNKTIPNESPVFSYSQNGEEITEEEYNTSLQNYEVPLTTAINWIKI